MKKLNISKKDEGKDLIPEESKEHFESLGKKLGFFISALNIPEQMKDVWLSVLPKMSLEQIERLINVFEEDYLKEKTQYIDEEFKKVLAEIEREKEEKLKKIDEETLEGINDLAKRITN